MSKKIELKVSNISGGLGQAHAYALLLQEVDSERLLPIIIGTSETQSILFTIKGLTPPRPFTHDLFITFADIFQIELQEVLIYKAKEGVFYSYLYFEKDDVVSRVDSRTSDAVALALRFGCPIYTTEAILAAESINTEEDKSVPLPITAVNRNLLDEGLDKAIRDEDYELASRLRDEIRRREQGDLDPEDNILNL